MKVELLLTLAERLQLKGARVSGGNVIASCPFAQWRHIKADGSAGKDRKASFGIRISPEGESLFNCFGCGSKGDLTWLCMELGDCRGQDYSEVEQWVWQNEGVAAMETLLKAPDPDEWGDPQPVAPELDTRDVYPETELEPYAGSVPRYALERGLTIETCRAWGLGHDTEDGRLTFPIRRWPDARLVGLKGRTYRDANAKYLPYLPFDMSNFLFGEHLVDADDPTRPRDRLVVVEGEIDVLRTWQAGFRCVGLMNGFASRAQRKKLEYWDVPLVLAHDQDERGRAWGQDVAQEFSEITTVYMVTFPEGAKDMASMLDEQIREVLADPRVYL